MNQHPELAAADDGVVLSVYVQPGAGRTELIGRHGAALKVRVAAPPTGGRANDAVVELVAKVFNVKPPTVAVIGGPTNRQKRVKLTGVDLADARRILDTALDDISPSTPRR